MKRRWTASIALLVISLVISACSSQASKPIDGSDSKGSQESKKTEAPASGASKANTDPTANAKPAKPTFVELEFRPVVWLVGSPPRPTGSGVWVYNKAAHPADITSIDWDKRDLVLVQLPADQFKGYKMEIQAIQDLGSDVFRFVCKITAPASSEVSSTSKGPAAWAEVPVGSLLNKRFVVADQDLKELPTD